MPEKTGIDHLLSNSSAFSLLGAVGDKEVEKSIHMLEENYSISWEETNFFFLVYIYWLFPLCQVVF